MDSKESGHTARFLVSLFLISKYSLRYVTSDSQCSILRYIADAMDEEFKISGHRKATLSLPQIVIYSRSSLATVKRCINHLVKFKILSKNGGKGKKPILWPGMLLRAYPQRSAKLRTSKLKSSKKVAHSELYLSIASNSNTYNKEISKIKHQKPDKKLNNLSSPDSCINAVRELAKKLNIDAKH